MNALSGDTACSGASSNWAYATCGRIDARQQPVRVAEKKRASKGSFFALRFKPAPGDGALVQR